MESNCVFESEVMELFSYNLISKVVTDGENNLGSDIIGLGPLDRLQPHWKVRYPLGLVITSSSMNKYYAVHKLLLRHRLIALKLSQAYVNMKQHCNSEESVTSGTLVKNLYTIYILIYCLLLFVEYKEKLYTQQRMITVFRQEVLHFVINMQAYFLHQVLDICWVDFSSSVNNGNIHSLEQLRELHNSMLDRYTLIYIS